MVTHWGFSTDTFDCAKPSHAALTCVSISSSTVPSCARDGQPLEWDQNEPGPTPKVLACLQMGCNETLKPTCDDPPIPPETSSEELRRQQHSLSGLISFVLSHKAFFTFSSIQISFQYLKKKKRMRKKMKSNAEPSLFCPGNQSWCSKQHSFIWSLNSALFSV